MSYATPRVLDARFAARIDAGRLRQSHDHRSAPLGWAVTSHARDGHHGDLRIANPTFGSARGRSWRGRRDRGGAGCGRLACRSDPY